LKKILVTGGCGFIGGAFIEYLLKITKYKISNIDKVTYASRNKNYFKKHKNYIFFKKDIRNISSCRYVINKIKPNIIVHFAAETHVDNSIKKPKIFLETNIMGTYNLLQESLKYLRKNPLNKNNFLFIHISTDEVFGDIKNLKGNSFKETTKYNPQNPYSATKASADHLVRSFFNTYNFPSIILNCSNNYGPNQHKEKLIPKTIFNILNNKKIPVYGQGKNIRDWIYVDDFARAILAVIKKGKIGETYNVGSFSEISNINIIRLICSEIDNKTKIKNSFSRLVKFVQDRPGHDFRYSIDASKIMKNLNWRPIVDLKNGIKKTVDWHITQFKIKN
jgi:dTDP-glucose 4,6-dehydratase